MLTIYSRYDAPYTGFDELTKPRTNFEMGFNMTAIKLSISVERHRLLKQYNKVKVNLIDEGMR